jgi:hypothetical protein
MKTTEAAGRNSAYGLRALAHPVRWKLIDLLESEESATATRCAEVLGQSVASCSYHLGILAKYGFIELVPGVPGREKPWRLASPDQDLSSPTSEPGEVLASQAASEAFLDHEMEQLKARLHSVRLETPAWRDASAAGGSSMYVTAEELLEIKEELMKVLRRYSERQSEPASRPTTARRARVFFSTTVDPPR